jgi:hypothetical protein
MTVAHLKTRTVKDLASMAKRKGVAGWHSMRKEELIQALVKHAKSEASHHAKRNGANGHGGTEHGARKGAKASNGNGRAAADKPRSARTERKLNQIKAKLALSKDLSLNSSREDGQTEARDRLVVMVRDPYWLHAYWELTRGSIERARAVLGQHWYGARPVLRVVEVARNGTTSSVRKVLRDIEIHGGGNNWYVDVDEPPRSFQMEIGYLALGGRFISLAKSNVVSTPPVGSVKACDGNWAGVAEDFDRIYALSGGYSDDGDHSDLKDLFEERLRRPMGASMATRFGVGASGSALSGGRREFCFQVDAELVVYGVTDPDAHVTIRGEPVRLQSDGSFRMRFTLPNRRQVLPVVASSGDGVQQRTIVLAVERNTKVMEPVVCEPDA